MGRDDLVERIKGELEFACAGGDPADIAQSGYRESLFSLFIEAYTNRLFEGSWPMTGGWVYGRLLELWEKENKTNKALKQVAHDFARMWTEWQYAWHRIDNHPEAAAR